jgi:hypothetical protein
MLDFFRFFNGPDADKERKAYIIGMIKEIIAAKKGSRDVIAAKDKDGFYVKFYNINNDYGVHYMSYYSLVISNNGDFLMIETNPETNKQMNMDEIQQFIEKIYHNPLYSNVKRDVF